VDGEEAPQLLQKRQVTKPVTVLVQQEPHVQAKAGPLWLQRQRQRRQDPVNRASNLVLPLVVQQLQQQHVQVDGGVATTLQQQQLR
jgi:hypothetical protein